MDLNEIVEEIPFDFAEKFSLKMCLSISTNIFKNIEN